MMARTSSTVAGGQVDRLDTAVFDVAPYRGLHAQMPLRRSDPPAAVGNVAPPRAGSRDSHGFR